MAADIFEAFRNWPRRAVYGVIWVGLIALLAATTQRDPVDDVVQAPVQWLKLEPVTTAAASPAEVGGVRP